MPLEQKKRSPSTAAPAHASAAAKVAMNRIGIKRHHLQQEWCWLHELEASFRTTPVLSQDENDAIYHNISTSPFYSNSWRCQYLQEKEAAFTVGMVLFTTAAGRAINSRRKRHHSLQE